MQLDDETLIAQFRDRTLSPEYFDHRGHLRVAWLYLRRYPLADACAHMCADTRAYATSLGAPGKYHHTITEALMRIVGLRLCGSENQNFDAFLAANPELLRNASGLLRRHYSDACLDSEAARSGWVAPDLTPID
ncbi:hypothetical protein [Microbulbifer magnicolonia]|uniref:hypothetical protein n=1 Tax=Microbulbifer magnicolonia TaxID=3109744 RepID=UPI002B403FCB|nr:hypothetical protein [Microbulbifer sp. GG15]